MSHEVRSFFEDKIRVSREPFQNSFNFDSQYKKYNSIWPTYAAGCKTMVTLVDLLLLFKNPTSA